MKLLRFILVGLCTAVRDYKRDLVEGVQLLQQLLVLGVWELYKLVRRYPLRTAFVLTITAIFVIMTTSLLQGSEFQVLPAWVKAVTPYAVGLGIFVGALNWSTRLFERK